MAKKATYKDRAPYNVNVVIEKKFQDDYKKALKVIFKSVSQNIIKMHKNAGKTDKK